MPQLDFSHGAAPFTDNDIHAQIVQCSEYNRQMRCVEEAPKYAGLLAN